VRPQTVSLVGGWSAERPAYELRLGWIRPHAPLCTSAPYAANTAKLPELLRREAATGGSSE
jgi:hypothetical protein